MLHLACLHAVVESLSPVLPQPCKYSATGHGKRLISTKKNKEHLGQLESTDTICCRYIDAPMADVARPGNEAPVLAPYESLEERAAAARERHALHHAQGTSFLNGFIYMAVLASLATWQ